MKLKAILFTLALAFLPLFSSGADQRFAVVDLDRIFREYYKSRIAEDAIRQQAESYRTHLVRLQSQLIQIQRDAERLVKETDNPLLPETERVRRKEAVEGKLREAAVREEEMRLYAADRAKTMREIEQKKRGEIMTEILQEVDRRALAEGYDFVFDSSGKTQNDQPALLRFPASVDLTAGVIRELNRTQPKEDKKQ